MLTNATPRTNTTASDTAAETCRFHAGVPLESVTHKFGTYQQCPLCEAERSREAERLREEERRARLLRGIPRHYHTAVLADFDPADFCLNAGDDSTYVPGGLPMLEKWLGSPRGFFYLYGDCGRGKTHVACAAMQYFNANGRPAIITFANEIFLTLRHSFGGKSAQSGEAEIISRVAPDNGRRHIAIIDDLGAQKPSEYVVEAWTLIIDRLYRHNIPTLVTTNYSPGEISKRLDDRIASRLASGPVVKLVGPDRRLQEHWACR